MTMQQNTVMLTKGKKSIGCVTREIVNTTTKKLYEFESLGKEKCICK